MPPSQKSTPSCSPARKNNNKKGGQQLVRGNGRHHTQSNFILKHHRHNQTGLAIGWRHAFLRAMCDKPSSLGENRSDAVLTSPATAPFAARASAGKPIPTPAPTATAPAAGSNEMAAATFWSASSRVVGSAASGNPVSRRRAAGVGDVAVVVVPFKDICCMVLRGSSCLRLYAFK